MIYDLDTFYVLSFTVMGCVETVVLAGSLIQFIQLFI